MIKILIYFYGGCFNRNGAGDATIFFFAVLHRMPPQPWHFLNCGKDQFILPYFLIVPVINLPIAWSL